MSSPVLAALVVSLRARVAIWLSASCLEYVWDVAVLFVEAATIAGVTRDVVYGAVIAGIVLSWCFA